MTPTTGIAENPCIASDSTIGLMIGLMAGIIFFIDGWGPSEKGTSFAKSRRFRGLAILISGGILSPVLDKLKDNSQYPFFIGYLEGSVIGWFSMFLLGLIIYLFWKHTKDSDRKKMWYKSGEFSYSILDFIYLGISDNPHLNAKREHDINIYKAQTDHELIRLQKELNNQDIKPNELDEATRKKIEEYEIQLKNVKTESDYTFEDWYYKGVAEFDKNEFEKTIAYMKNAIEKTPEAVECADAYLYMGLAYEHMELLQKAIEQFDIIISKFPSYMYMHVAYYNKSVMLGKLHDYQNAFDNNELSLQYKPNYITALINRADMLGRLERHDEALAAYNVLTTKDAKTWYNLGVLYDKMSRNEDAVNAYDEALALQTDYPQAWNNKGVNLRKLEKYDDALAAFDKAIEYRPDYALAWYNTACLQGYLKKKDVCLLSLRIAIRYNAEYKQSAQKQPEFAFLWDDPDFLEVVK